MTKSELTFREIPLPMGTYSSRMAALNACLNAMTASNLQIEKIAVFEDPPHALLQISQDKPKNADPKRHLWLTRLISKTSQEDHKITTLKLMILRRHNSEDLYILKYEINP